MVETYKPPAHTYILIMDGGRPTLIEIQATGKVGTATDLVGDRVKGSHMGGTRRGDRHTTLHTRTVQGRSKIRTV